MSAERTKIPCSNSGCSESFSNRMAKKRHLDSGKCRGAPPVRIVSVEETTDGKFLCKKCNSILAHRNNVARHVRVCKGVPKEDRKKDSYICDVEGCEKEFNHKSKLMRHVLTHQNDGKIYVCSKCSKTYQKKDRLEKHEQSCNEVFPSMANFSDRGDDVNSSSISCEIEASDCMQVELNTDIDKENVEPYFPDSVRQEVGHNLDEWNNTPRSPIDFTSITNAEENNGLDMSTIAELEARKEEFLQKDRKRKLCTSRLSIITNVLSTVKEGEKAEILKKLCTSQEELKVFMSCNRDHLKLLITKSSRSEAAKQEAKNYLRKVYGKNLDNQEFLTWLANLLDMRSVVPLSIILCSENTTTVGRKMTPEDQRQQVYDFWKSNSEVSVHRSNGRHYVKISSKNLKKQVIDLQDDEISVYSGKRGEKKKAHRRLTSEPYHILYKKYKETHSELSLSYGLFINLKPFYISPPTTKEMEMCMCSSCLNPHCMYKALKNAAEEDMPYSLTDYLTKDFKCNKEEDIKFVSIKCITGKCENKCTVVDMKKDFEAAIKKNPKNLIAYYIFEQILQRYFDKHGDEKEYKRTARVDKKELLVKLIENLENVSQKYLLHRYRVVNNSVHWTNFKAQTTKDILWLDYSQNIDLQEKRQAQSAYYSGKQQTLHCSIILHPDNRCTYIYHLSDDTRHDAVMTFEVIEQILKEHPQLLADKTLILRSDNCEDQYKCRFVFHRMAELAKILNINIFWFYGAPGHGKGLIDAMSSFGCKQKLRHAIIANDAWFKDASAMVDFLNDIFSDDPTKEHHLIDERKNAETRSTAQGELRVKPCRKYDLIAINPQRLVKKILYYKGEPLDSIFDSEQVLPEHNNNEEDSDDDEDDDPFQLDVDTVSELAVAGTFAAMRSCSISCEQFVLVEIISSGTATKDMIDSSGHVIEQGKRYAEAIYLGKEAETKKHVRYRRSTKSKPVLINIGEVFATNVALSADLKMDIYEYQALQIAAISPGR